MNVRASRDFGRPDVVSISTAWEEPDGTTVYSRGTGFVIRAGVVATALHVVTHPDDYSPKYFELTFCRPGPDGTLQETLVDSDLRIISWPENPLQDWALLSFPTPPGEHWPALKLNASASRGVSFHSHGFAHPEGKGIDGELVSRSTNRAGQLLMELRVKQLACPNPDDVEGYSGAPVMVGDCAVGIILSGEVDPSSKPDAEEDPPIKGATLFAAPIAWLRDEYGQPVCQNERATVDHKETIEKKVLPVLRRSSALRDAILDEFVSDWDRKLAPAHLDTLAADKVSDTPTIQPLLDAADAARENGADSTDIRELLAHALRGCHEYVQLAQRFRQDLLADDVAVLAYPVSTLPQLEVVMAASESRSAALKFRKDRRPGNRLAGMSHLSVSDFRPDAFGGPGSREGDAALVSVIVALAGEVELADVRPAEVYEFLHNVRVSPLGWARADDPMEGIVRHLNNVVAQRKKRIRAHRPPFYVAVTDRQKAGLDVIKEFLPRLRVGVLGHTTILDEALFNDVLISLFTGE